MKRTARETVRNEAPPGGDFCTETRLYDNDSWPRVTGSE